MAEYRLSPQADDDLDAIYDFGLLRFGELQADRFQEQLHAQFQLLAEFPGIGGAPLPVTFAALYSSPFARHIVVYAKTDYGIRIVRVFHGSVDYMNKLRRSSLPLPLGPRIPHDVFWGGMT